MVRLPRRAGRLLPRIPPDLSVRLFIRQLAERLTEPRLLRLCECIAGRDLWRALRSNKLWFYFFKFKELSSIVKIMGLYVK